MSEAANDSGQSQAVKDGVEFDSQPLNEDTLAQLHGQVFYLATLHALFALALSIACSFVLQLADTTVCTEYPVKEYLFAATALGFAFAGGFILFLLDWLPPRAVRHYALFYVWMAAVVLMTICHIVGAVFAFSSISECGSDALGAMALTVVIVFFVGFGALLAWGASVYGCPCIMESEVKAVSISAPTSDPPELESEALEREKEVQEAERRRRLEEAKRLALPFQKMSQKIGKEKMEAEQARQAMEKEREEAEKRAAKAEKLAKELKEKEQKLAKQQEETLRELQEAKKELEKEKAKELSLEQKLEQERRQKQTLEQQTRSSAEQANQQLLQRLAEAEEIARRATRKAKRAKKKLLETQQAQEAHASKPTDDAALNKSPVRSRISLQVDGKVAPRKKGVQFDVHVSQSTADFMGLKSDITRGLCDRCSDMPAVIYCEMCAIAACDHCDTILHKRGALAQHHRELITVIVTDIPDVCPRCEENKTTVRCATCNGFFCDKCNKLLHKSKRKQAHTQTPIENVKLSKTAAATPKAKKMKSKRKQEEQHHADSEDDLDLEDGDDKASGDRKTHPAKKETHKAVEAKRETRTATHTKQDSEELDLDDDDDVKPAKKETHAKQDSEELDLDEDDDVKPAKKETHKAVEAKRETRTATHTKQDSEELDLDEDDDVKPAKKETHKAVEEKETHAKQDSEELDLDDDDDVKPAKNVKETRKSAETKREAPGSSGPSGLGDKGYTGTRGASDSTKNNLFEKRGAKVAGPAGSRRVAKPESDELDLEDADDDDDDGDHEPANAEAEAAVGDTTPELSPASSRKSTLKSNAVKAEADDEELDLEF